jgi:hypothetical protein
VVDGLRWCDRRRRLPGLIARPVACGRPVWKTGSTSEMATTFYRFDINGALHGLVRREQVGDAGSVFSRVGDDGWVVDQSLFRHLIDPGDIPLIEITEAEAQWAAHSYGVELAALSVDDMVSGQGPLPRCGHPPASYGGPMSRNS